MALSISYHIYVHIYFLLLFLLKTSNFPVSYIYIYISYIIYKCYIYIIFPFCADHQHCQSLGAGGGDGAHGERCGHPQRRRAGQPGRHYAHPRPRLPPRKDERPAPPPPGPQPGMEIYELLVIVKSFVIKQAGSRLAAQYWTTNQKPDQ